MKKPKYYVRPDGLHETIRLVDGKRVAFRGKTDAEVERKMIAYQGKVEQGRLFSEVADDWEQEHFPTLAPNTLKGYRPALKSAIDEFGNRHIKEIEPPDIKAWLEGFKRQQMAKKTVATRRLIMNLICSYAVQNKDLKINPCAEIDLPTGLSKTYREPASTADEKRIKATPTNSWLLPYLILYTGLRRGEALGLTFDDIDRRKEVIIVRRSVYHIDNRPYIKAPKSEAGYRTVPILNQLKERLPKGKGEKYIFSLDGGETPITNDQYQKLWKDYAAEYKISCTAHQLRHSYATMLHECDIDVKDAQDLLGHSTVAMTQDVYTHIRDNRKIEVAKKINKKLDGKKKIAKTSNNHSAQEHV